MLSLAFPSLSFSAAPWIVVPALLAGAGAAIYYYRSTLPLVRPTMRVLLAALRGIALAALILALFEPLAMWATSVEREPEIAVVIDRSASMSIVNSSQDRPRDAREILRKIVASAVARRARYSVFADTLAAIDRLEPDSVTFTGAATDLARAIRSAERDATRRNLRAVLLITDGAATAGGDPRDAAAAGGLPVYAIGIGDSNEIKNVSVSAVIAPDVATIDAVMPIEVRIRAAGFDNVPLEVTLREEDRILDRRRVVVTRASKDYGASFTAALKSEGMRKFSVTVSPLPGELSTRDNSRTFFVRVLRGERRIALVAGGPSPDVAFLQRALARFGHYKVDAIIQKQANALYPGVDPQKAFAAAECIVVADFPTLATEDALIEGIARAVRDRAVPLLFIGGPDVDARKLKAWEEILPFVPGTSFGAEQACGVSISAGERFNPLVRIEGARDSALWADLPTVYYKRTGAKAKPESELVARVSLEGVPSPEPAIVAQSLGRRRTAAILPYGLWRWTLMGRGVAASSGDTAGPDVFSSFVSNAVQWLTAPAADKQFHARPVKPVFSPSEPVEFAGQVFDAKFTPVEDANVTIEVKGVSGSYSVALASQGSGLYGGQLSGLPEGDYTTIGLAERGGARIGEDRSRFTIADAGAEFNDPRMDATMLSSIAARTGGLFAPASSADAVLDSLARDRGVVAQIVTSHHELELWNSAWLLGAALACLAAEWGLRKKKGML
jgi:hypothetical protein